MSDLKVVIEQIQEVKKLCDEEYAGDDQLFQDMLEAETNANEIMAWAIDKIADETALLNATKERIEKLNDRKKANQNRIDKLKSIFGDLLAMTNKRSFKNEVCTVSLKATPAKVIIQDENEIPELFKKQETKINLTDIGKQLKDGNKVNGCTLSNGGETLSFRF